jgi:hypothetical protein
MKEPHLKPSGAMETRERSTLTTQRPMLVARRHSVTEPENFYNQLGHSTPACLIAVSMS